MASATPAPKQLAKLDLDSERQKSAMKRNPKSGSGTLAPRLSKVAVATVGADSYSDAIARPQGAQKRDELAKTQKEASFKNKKILKKKSMTSTIDGNQVQIAETTAREESSSPKNPKAAKTKASPTKPSQPSPNDEDGEKTRGNGGEEEPPAKGLYDIFVQTRRCEERCYELGLTLRDIRKIKKKYDENDMYHTGEITQAEFFFIINESRRPLTTGIFQYANVSMDQKLVSFDEYLLCVVSFASITPPELFQFVFDLYDADKSGPLDEKEFATMSKELQSHQFAFPKNVATAIAMIEGKDPTGKKDTRRGYLSEDGLVDLNEFLKFTHLFPVAFFPMFNFQKNVRRVALGENKWSRLVARKLKIQELVSHMRRKYGSIPEMTWCERLASVFDPHVMDIRKRASKIYGQEITQRQLIGDADS